MYMKDYVEQLDLILSSGNRKLLTDKGKISHKKAIEKAKMEYKKYQVKTFTAVEKEYMNAIKEMNKKIENKN